MKELELIYERMKSFGDSCALFENEKEYSYQKLVHLIEEKRSWIRENETGVAIWGVLGDYSLDTISFLFALMLENQIVAPLTYAIQSELPEFIRIGSLRYLIEVKEGSKWKLDRFTPPQEADLLTQFRKRNHPGLIVFTSGSTGKPKGILHDVHNVAKKFVTPRKGWRTVLFLMMDHFGGFNTLLSVFSYGGVGVCLPSRNPEVVCKTIELSKADLLPTTPTFLKLMMASRSYTNYDLSSVQLITYGTEVMSEKTLNELNKIFPKAQFKQTYGLSELGVLRSESEKNSSTWFKIGGAGFEIKIKENMLWIRSEANMIGYLNAENPFDEEGWFYTGDEVEQNGDFIRIKGRKSEIINVGGQKVFPSEVEEILLMDPNVADITVYGTPHPIMGQVVEAKVSTFEEEDRFQLKTRLQKLCREKLAGYKVPLKFHVEKIDEHYNARYKKQRPKKQLAGQQNV